MCIGNNSISNVIFRGDITAGFLAAKRRRPKCRISLIKHDLLYLVDLLPEGSAIQWRVDSSGTIELFRFTVGIKTELISRGEAVRTARRRPWRSREYPSDRKKLRMRLPTAGDVIFSLSVHNRRRALPRVLRREGRQSITF